MHWVVFFCIFQVFFVIIYVDEFNEDLTLLEGIKV